MFTNSEASCWPRKRVTNGRPESPVSTTYDKENLDRKEELTVSKFCCAFVQLQEPQLFEGTPSVCRTIDRQHSSLSGYLDGPRGKCSAGSTLHGSGPVIPVSKEA